MSKTLKIDRDALLNHNIEIDELENTISEMVNMILKHFPVYTWVNEFANEYRSFLNHRAKMDTITYESYLEQFMLDIPYLLSEVKSSRTIARDRRNTVELDKKNKYDEVLAKKLGIKDERIHEANKATLTETFLVEAHNRVVNILSDQIDFLEKAQSSIKTVINKRLSDRKLKND